MAKADKTQTKPMLDIEVAAISGVEDIAAAYADELRLPRDGVLRTRGDSDIGLYEKVRTDGQVQSNFQQLRTAIISHSFTVDAGADDPQSEKAAEFLRDNLSKISFDRICYKMLMAVFNGYQPGECMWRAEGTQIWLSDIKVRHARRFRFGRDGELRLITQVKRQGTVMPERKFWTFTCGGDDDDDPYGLGLGHYLYWPVFLKRGGLRHLSLFIEQMARGRFGATVPAGTKPEVRKQVEQMLSKLSGGGSVVVSDNVAIQLYTAAQNSGGDTILFIKYLDEMISKITLSQTMTTDSGASLSQAQVHEGVSEDVVQTYSDLICESFNTTVSRWLTEWNYPGATPPKVYRNCRSPADTQALATRDKVLDDMGYEMTDDYLTETYGDGFVRKTKATPPEKLNSDAPAIPPAPAELEAADFAESEDPDDEWRPIIEPTVQNIEALLSECSSLEEFRDRLGEVAQRDKQEAMTEHLARGLFASRVAGRVGATADATESND